MKYENLNKKLCALFGIPNDATEATLVMKAGKSPVLSVTRLITNSPNKVVDYSIEMFKLVPIDDDEKSEETSE